jgi:cytochrome oxidase Cu insertion factor (SCO1/SenC/PrrC family)
MTRRMMGFLAVALASILAASCGSSGEGGRTRERSLREGDLAPGFTLPSARGPEVSLADFRGQKPTLLYFSMGPG